MYEHKEPEHNMAGVDYKNRYASASASISLFV